MSERVQSQFLNVIDRDEAERRFHEALDLSTVAQEQVKLGDVSGPYPGAKYCCCE